MNINANDNIHNLLISKKNMEITIRDLEKKVEHIKILVHRTDKILWERCNHEWIRDPDSIYDNIKYRCIQCKLWRHPTRYE